MWRFVIYSPYIYGSVTWWIFFCFFHFSADAVVLTSLGYLHEVFQDEHTYASTHDGLLRLGSRIDRWFLCLPPADLISLSPTSCTLFRITERDRPSDHVPVNLAVGGSGRRPMRLPRWVFKHPLFFPTLELVHGALHRGRTGSSSKILS